MKNYINIKKNIFVVMFFIFIIKCLFINEMIAMQQTLRSLRTTAPLFFTNVLLKNKFSSQVLPKIGESGLGMRNISPQNALVLVKEVETLGLKNIPSHLEKEVLEHLKKRNISLEAFKGELGNLEKALEEFTGQFDVFSGRTVREVLHRETLLLGKIKDGGVHGAKALKEFADQMAFKSKSVVEDLVGVGLTPNAAAQAIKNVLKPRTQKTMKEARQILSREGDAYDKWLKEMAQEFKKKGRIEPEKWFLPAFTAKYPRTAKVLAATGLGALGYAIKEKFFPDEQREEEVKKNEQPEEKNVSNKESKGDNGDNKSKSASGTNPASPVNNEKSGDSAKKKAFLAGLLSALGIGGGSIVDYFSNKKKGKDDNGEDNDVLEENDKEKREMMQEKQGGV